MFHKYNQKYNRNQVDLDNLLSVLSSTNRFCRSMMTFFGYFQFNLSPPGLPYKVFGNQGFPCQKGLSRSGQNKRLYFLNFLLFY